MKRILMRWMMTNLCAWVACDPNPVCRRAYLKLWAELARASRAAADGAGKTAGLPL